MGIFDIFKSESNSNLNKSERDIKSILTELNINPYDYNHEEMNSREISLEEELVGYVKVSDLDFENGENRYNSISLSENKNGKKSLSLTLFYQNEREIKDLIDEFISKLGEDSLCKREFTYEDLEDFKKTKSGEFRDWELTDFNITIGFNKPGIGFLYILIMEK